MCTDPTARGTAGAKKRRRQSAGKWSRRWMLATVKLRFGETAIKLAASCTLPIVSEESTGSAMYMKLRVDRKSTRLNSSHLVISYAVFCLKKKKKKIKQREQK